MIPANCQLPTAPGVICGYFFWWSENFSVILRGVTDLLKKLREAWRQLESAKKSVNNAQTHKTDAAVVFGCTGFAIEHINKAKRLIEEVGKDLKRSN